MYETLRNFPAQFLTGYRLCDFLDLSLLGKKVDQVILAAMGGSSLPGDLINDYLSGSRKLSIVRDYSFPLPVPDNDLILCVSCSGNTEETLEAFSEAVRLKKRVIALAHGGLLRERAGAASIPFVEIPECIQPRCAVGYFFGALLGILEKIGWILPDTTRLSELTRFLERGRDRQEKAGKELAGHLTNRVPIIYGPSELTGICRVMKIKFNENAKIPCFWNVFPELNHNEMVGYTRSLMPATFIFLRSKFMGARIGRRMDVMKDLFKDRYPILEIKLEGDTLLKEMFDGLAVADYASYYLAKNYGIDPAAVEMVEEFKKRL